MELTELVNIIRPILTKHRVKKAAVFGSVVRGEASKDSDVDILVELEDQASLFAFIALKLDLEDALSRNVDLVEFGSIKPRLRDFILPEAVMVL